MKYEMPIYTWIILYSLIEQFVVMLLEVFYLETIYVLLFLTVEVKGKKFHIQIILKFQENAAHCTVSSGMQPNQHYLHRTVFFSFLFIFYSYFIYLHIQQNFLLGQIVCTKCIIYFIYFCTFHDSLKVIKQMVVAMRGLNMCQFY